MLLKAGHSSLYSARRSILSSSTWGGSVLEILEFSSPLLPAANAAQAHVSEPNRAKSTRATRAGEGRSRPSPAPSPSVNVYLAEPARPEASARRPLGGPNHLANRDAEAKGHCAGRRLQVGEKHRAPAQPGQIVCGRRWGRWVTLISICLALRSRQAALLEWGWSEGDKRFKNASE